MHESRKFLSLLLLLNRLTIGWYIAAVGFRKLAGEFSNGFGTFYRGESFAARSPDWVPDSLMAAYGYALPWAEVTVGLLLLVGLFSRVAGWALCMILVSIALALFGAGELFPAHHVTVFLSLALLLAVLGGGSYSLDAVLEWRSHSTKVQQSGG